MNIFVELASLLLLALTSMRLGYLLGKEKGEYEIVEALYSLLYSSHFTLEVNGKKTRFVKQEEAENEKV